ncbi:hypothetical protein F5883DRAFT_154292 [Diaporthe sp. PMI_573]|nr:hypothetical protein F5883DRAFT_154292 [Diaporthaceae sp. PMI_573]
MQLDWFYTIPLSDHYHNAKMHKYPDKPWIELAPVMTRDLVVDLALGSVLAIISLLHLFAIPNGSEIEPFELATSRFKEATQYSYNMLRDNHKKMKTWMYYKIVVTNVIYLSAICLSPRLHINFFASLLIAQRCTQ